MFNKAVTLVVTIQLGWPSKVGHPRLPNPFAPSLGHTPCSEQQRPTLNSNYGLH